MNLDRKSWYVRLFFWALGIWDEFARDYDSAYEYKNGTNLCHFVRVICFLAPLVLLLHMALLIAAFGTITAMPIYLFGLGGYLSGVTVLVLLVAIPLGIKAGWKYLRRQRDPYAEAVKKASSSAPSVRATSKVKAEGPSAWQILWQWLVTQKKKVCPVISFNGGGDL